MYHMVRSILYDGFTKIITWKVVNPVLGATYINNYSRGESLTVVALLRACSVSCSMRVYVAYSFFRASCFAIHWLSIFLTVDISTSVLFRTNVNFSFCSCSLEMDFLKPSISVSMDSIFCCCWLQVKHWAQ